jgi:4,5-dihydroxyphthalate decarboxylase
LSELLLAGEIDALIGPRTPSVMTAADPQVGWLFPIRAAPPSRITGERRTFPIMHLIGVRRTLVEQHPWLPAAVLKAFEQAKARAFAKLADTSASRACCRSSTSSCRRRKT